MLIKLAALDKAGCQLNTNEPKIENIKFSKDQLFNILEATPVGMIISRVDGRFEHVNPAFMEMLGYSEDEIYQPELIISHNDDLDINQNIRSQLLSNPNQPITAEKRYVKKDGQAILSLVSVVALQDDHGEVTCFVAQAINIEYRKKIEESADLFRSIINASQDSMFIISPQTGKILDANEHACDFLGYSYEEILKLHILDIDTTIKDSNDWTEYVGHLKQKNNILICSNHQHKNGTSLPVEISVDYIQQNNFEYLLAISRDITERKKSEALIWQQANYDMLTKLPNRNMLHKKLEGAIKKAHLNNTQIAVLCLDLDQFKDVNDTLGHDAGDKLLIEASARISACLREADIVSRLGGDEFCVIIENIETTSTINNIATTILASLEEPFILGINKVFISTSIGIALFPDDAANVDDLLKLSDQAMYFAKNDGRNCFQYFTVCMQEKILEKMRLSRDLHDALLNDQFYLMYQPIISLSDDKVTKAEVLLRWNHPEQNLINPEEFISIAEENGTIGRIGEMVFSKATQMVKEWQQRFDTDLQISINASPLQLKEGPGNINNWSRELKKIGLPGKSILIEMTEGLMMDTSQENIDKFLMLRDAGIQVALDDFGTGYSSLAYLQKLDIDYLKIDRSFIKNLKPGSDEQALCEAIIVMAHRLRLQVVAEGIETKEQLQLLKASGCDYGQGFLLSKPLATEEFEQLLANQNNKPTTK